MQVRMPANNGTVESSSARSPVRDWPLTWRFVGPQSSGGN
jgi:hypothetical protein